MSAKLFWRFASDAGTITASSNATGFAPAKLQNVILANKWKSDGTDSADYITVDLGSAQSIGAFAFLDHDIEATDTLELKYASDSGFTTDTGTISLTYNATTMIEYFTAAVSRQYWRFTITKASGTESRSAGRLLLGSVFTLTNSTREPGGILGATKTTGNKVLTDGGQTYANLGAQLNQLQGEIAGLDNDDYDEIEALKEAYGIAVPFIFSAAPTNDLYRRSIYGTFDSLPRFTSIKPGAYNASISLLEQK